MRIRDRLIALATASLTPSRTTRGSGAAPHAPSGEDELAAIEAEPGAKPPALRGELPRQLGEQMLQSIHASLQRLAQTTEALSVLASAIATAEATVRQHLAATTNATSPAGPGTRIPPPNGPPNGAGGPIYPGPPLRHAAAPPRRAQALSSPPINLASGVMTLALHAANSRSLDGTYLFTGSGGEPPFATDGSYRGTSSSSIVVLLPGPPPHLAVAAAALTCLGPLPSAMDILPRLARAQLACGNGARNSLEACRGPLAEAAAQLAYLQARVDAAATVLADATAVTAELIPARASLSESESDQPTAQLAQTFGALEAARSLAERTLAIFPAKI